MVIKINQFVLYYTSVKSILIPYEDFISHQYYFVICRIIFIPLVDLFVIEDIGNIVGFEYINWKFYTIDLYCK